MVQENPPDPERATEQAETAGIQPGAHSDSDSRGEGGLFRHLFYSVCFYMPYAIRNWK